jgi:hypothetical protein
MALKKKNAHAFPIRAAAASMAIRFAHSSDGNDWWTA